ncbi:MAG TPA: hypothetical protein PKK00_00185 [Bacteroidales bacterium]|nr:hypothetical protein [Bacteroidales bacterium]HPS16265.1 hypothetical protein [Bacteroidales bacterium]
MFNFKKKNEINPINEVLNDLTINQKMSVLNLLLTIAICDGDQGNNGKEIFLLSTYINTLAINSERCTEYFKSGGQARIISDLKPLSPNQKEFLVIAAYEMMSCDAKPNEKEIIVTTNIFKQIGINEDNFIATVQKSKELVKLFFGK